MRTEARPARFARGFTLLEVLVSLVIMAMIATLAAQAFNTASMGAAATREAMARLAEIDRAFTLMEADLRNARPKTVRQRFGELLPAIMVSNSDDYWLTLVRGGLANPLVQRRSEEVRVGYRYVDNTLWRDTWYNLSLSEQHQARQTRILTDVRSLRVRLLPPNATSLAAGPWLDAWPPQGMQMPEGAPFPMPLAVEVVLELDDMGEIRRLFSILSGHGGQVDPGYQNPHFNNPEGDGTANPGDNE